MSDRRYGKILSVALIVVMTGFLLVGCGGTTSDKQASSNSTAETSQNETTANQGRQLKVGFIYVSPAGDFGYSHAHDRGRKIVDEKYDWLNTVTAESVAPADVGSTIDSMFSNGADVIFSTSFGFMQTTVKKGEEWPDKILYHASGGPAAYKGMTGKEFESDNVGFYFADFYQIYYLNGIMAGALSEDDKIGYVAAHQTSEVLRHLNAFYLGAKAVNPDIKMKVIETGSWYDPSATQSAANTLIDWGADALGFTVDSPSAIQAAQSHFEETGDRVYSFSHYTPMKGQGKDVVISGQLVKWEVLYEDLILKARAGKVEPSQHWKLLHSGAVEMGSDWNEPVNPKLKDKLKNAMVDNPDPAGPDRISALDLVQKRLDQYKSLRVLHHPFTGPIRNVDGKLMMEEGESPTDTNLRFRFGDAIGYIEGITPP